MMGRFPLQHTSGQRCPLHGFWEVFGAAGPHTCPVCLAELAPKLHAVFTPNPNPSFMIPSELGAHRGSFVVNVASQLTRLPNGTFHYSNEAPAPDAGLTEKLPDKLGGFRGWLEPPPELDAALSQWMARAQERAKLRRCKPMIERLRKQFAEEISKEYRLQPIEFGKTLKASQQDGGGWEGVYFNGPFRAHRLAVDLEVYNALQ